MTQPEIINYRGHGDGWLQALTEDGFMIVITSRDPDDDRTIQVWPYADGVLVPFAALTEKRQSVESCKDVAAELLAQYRVIAEHFREQGRAEVRAAQGQMAAAMIPIPRDNESDAFADHERDVKDRMAKAMKPISTDEAIAILDPDEVTDVGEVRINVSNDQELPVFGAYFAGSASQGKAIIVLNMTMNLALAKATDRPFSEVLAGSLAHEILHVCQEICGARFCESDINAAMAQIKPDDFLQTDEDMEQMIQSLTIDNEALHKEIAELRGALNE